MGTNLKFVRLNNVTQIPRYLLAQVRPQDFNIDAFYKWAPVLFKNPLNLFGGFLDKDKIIKGIMWLSFNPITEKLTVHMISVDREYYNRGILKEADGILHKLKKKMNAISIIAQTTRPKALGKIGYVKSKTVILEK